MDKFRMQIDAGLVEDVGPCEHGAPFDGEGCPWCRISRLERQVKDLEKSLEEEIENRDWWIDEATNLAIAVGQHFDADVGEWSSGNNPVHNAYDLLGVEYDDRIMKMGFEKCQWGPEPGDYCERCKTKGIQMYFAGDASGEGTYWCRKCIIEVHDQNEKDVRENT